MDVRKQFAAKKIYRGSQMIFGERHHLEEVLQSIRRVRLPRARKKTEIAQLSKLIRVRTKELNGLNPGWDRKFKKARDPHTKPSELVRLAAALSPDDYLFARVLTEHAGAPSEMLERLASHPYPAVRENVARHPNTPPAVLKRMADESAEPLWFLVACNPSTPPDLRDRLRTRMQQTAAR
jgi:hypothetical protein